MQSILSIILTILITFTMQTSAIGIVTTTPEDATDALMKGLKKCDEKTLEKYMDNTYINLLCNEKGNKKASDRVNDALFKNFSYEIKQVKEKNDVAVAKVVIKCNDFSGVMPAYSKASYDYVMENLYEDFVGDKAALEKKFLELYVSEVEKAAKNNKTIETTVFVPMVDDGFYGWNVLLTDELMAQILGNLSMPAIK